MYNCLKCLLLYFAVSCYPHKESYDFVNIFLSPVVYQGLWTRMVYLDYITCLRYSILVPNPRYELSFEYFLENLVFSVQLL